MKFIAGKLAVFSLIFNLLFVLFFIGRRMYYESRSVADTQKKYETQSDLSNNIRAGIYSDMPVDSTDIVFVGNSLTEGFPVTELFHSVSVKNRGIGWNQTKHLLARLPGILKGRPKKIFIEIGVNDLTISHLTVPATFAQYQRILDTIKTVSPSTRIVVQLLMPTSMAFAGYLPSIQELNSKLSAYCKENNITVADTYTPFLKNGQLDSSLTYDGVHLNHIGYKIWEKQIDSLVKM